MTFLITVNGVIFHRTSVVGEAFALFASWRGRGYDVTLSRGATPSLAQVTA